MIRIRFFLQVLLKVLWSNLGTHYLRIWLMWIAKDDVFEMKNAKIRQFEIIELYDDVVLPLQIEFGSALMMINALLVFIYQNQTLSYNTRISNSPSFRLFFLWKPFVPLCNGCLECKTRRLSFFEVCTSTMYNYYHHFFSPPDT
jgi:hypothetical protein